MSGSHLNYLQYVSDESYLATYNAYQARYAVNIRESDKTLLSMLRDSVKDRRAPEILDIGCSTGNFLLHAKRLIPGAKFVGGELALSSIEECRGNPALADVDFEVMDMLSLKATSRFDAIVANAVAVYFTWEEYAKAMSSVRSALKPGGVYLAFEWIHPFLHQDIVIHETSLAHPGGLRICYRPAPKVEATMSAAGFSSVAFYPFELPIDLPRPPDDGEVVSYTVPTSDGRRIIMRGALAQPWCHIVARAP